MAMRVLVMVVMRVFMAIVFVGPGVWVSVVKCAVTVQFALDGLIGGGWHGQASVGRVCVGGLDR